MQVCGFDEFRIDAAHGKNNAFAIPHGQLIDAHLSHPVAARPFDKLQKIRVVYDPAHVGVFVKNAH